MTNVQVAVLGVCLFASPFLMFGTWVVVAYRFLDKVEASFSNSPMVVGNKAIYAHAGMLGQIMRLGSVSAMLSMKDFCIRKGMLDAEDVRSAPQDLKKMLICLWLVHLLLFVLLAMFCIWISFLR
ncbi:hypothetical protein [Pseudomonas plecoglossicida]|uniref:hypothetical protein n=1 Tax=Pseudomonas plecoglossicida TaxID=70775 RepID=UPI003D1E84AD